MSEKATSIPEEQEAFEAWAVSIPGSVNVTREDGGYRFYLADMFWEAWQARASLAATERQDSQSPAPDHKCGDAAIVVLQAMDRALHDSTAAEILDENSPIRDAMRDVLKTMAGRFDSQALPDGWVPLTIAWDADYPEEVAYGPKIMMDRLKKWLDKFYALRLASQALPEQPSGDATSAYHRGWHDGNETAKKTAEAVAEATQAPMQPSEEVPSAGAIEEWRVKAEDYDRLAVIARNRRMVLEEIAGLRNLTATDKQFWQALQRLAEKAVNDYTFQGDYEDRDIPAAVEPAWKISERMPSHHRSRTSLENINDVLEALAAPTQAGGEAFECERCGLPQSQHTATHWCDNQSFAGPNGEVILGVHGGRAIAAAPAAAPTQALPEQPSDHDLMQALEERDRYHDMADDLAAQIAAITGEEIGEHSSANDPWRNAMLAADEFIAKLLRKLLTPPAPMQPSELVTQFESAVNACTRYHTEYMGKAMPDREYERFARLRDETIPRLRAALNAALAAPTQAAPAAQESIRIDFRQATDLLAMFGGEPAEITLALWGDEGHDGPGLYAWYTDYPEVGTKLYAAAPAADVEPHSDGSTWQDLESAAAMRAAAAPEGLTEEQIEALIVGLTAIKNQRWFVRAEVIAIVRAAIGSAAAKQVGGKDD